MNTNNKSNQPQNQGGYKENLEFWNFTDEGLRFCEKTAFETSFPQGKLATSDEMKSINETLTKRLQNFKNSSCYSYLDCYYDYYIKTQNSKTDEDIEKNFDYSLKCLKLFTFCWEIEREEKIKQGSMENNYL